MFKILHCKQNVVEVIHPLSDLPIPQPSGTFSSQTFGNRLQANIVNGGAISHAAFAVKSVVMFSLSQLEDISFSSFSYNQSTTSH